MSSGFITLHTAEVQGSDSGGMTVYVQVDKILYFTECVYRTDGGEGDRPERKGARIALDGGGDLFVKEGAAEVQEKLAKALEKSVVVMASGGKPQPCDPVPAAAPSQPTRPQALGPWSWDISITDNGGSYVTANPNGTIVSYTSSGDH